MRLCCYLFHFIWLAALCIVLPATANDQAKTNVAEPPGAKVYRQQCAACHGKTGEGTDDEYPHALVGDKSVAELTSFIEKSMPKGSVGDCVGADARNVAAYIHQAFYSKTAQARNKPARIELSRLTIRQYQNAVADLVGSFRGSMQWNQQHGLRGEYFKSRRMRNNESAIERLDPTVAFNFKESSADAKKIDPKEFSIRWQGSLIAPDTGDYELIVKTENAARLWINNDNRALIDAWVRSGNDTEFRGTIRLLGGRAYPLRFEFFKSKEKTASIALWWKAPYRAAELIPARHLSPQRFPKLTSSPRRSRRTTAVWDGARHRDPKAWDQATTDAALNVAAEVARRLNELAGIKDDAPDRKDRARDFCRQFAERAWRRPLTKEQTQAAVEQQFKDARDPEAAVKRVVLLVLKSPRFLYRELGSARGDDPYAVASRLSFALWDSLPDRVLLDAAAKGQPLPDQIGRQAERMLTDLRAAGKARVLPGLAEDGSFERDREGSGSSSPIQRHHRVLTARRSICF